MLQKLEKLARFLAYSFHSSRFPNQDLVHTRKSKDNKQNILIVPKLNLVLKVQLKLGFVDTLGPRRLDASLKIFIMSVLAFFDIKDWI